MSILDLFKPNEPEKFISRASEEEVRTVKDNTPKENGVKKALDRFRALDDEAAEFYRTFEPPVKTEKTGNRTFIKLGDQEFIAEFVTDINVDSLGGGPSASAHHDSFPYHRNTNVMVCGPVAACVSANLVSGKQVKFYCNRHAVDAVYMALRDAWLSALKGSFDNVEKAGD